MDILRRIEDAINAVERRLRTTVATLASAKIPYALTDDNAVAAHVTRVDEAAIRHTPDVSILIRREDFDAAVGAMRAAGFVHHSQSGVELFIDSPLVRDGVQFFFAGEPVGPGLLTMHADLHESEVAGDCRVLTVFALARTKLATFRDRDRLNLRDLIDVGLIDQTWPARFPAELAARLQLLLDTPGG